MIKRLAVLGVLAVALFLSLERAHAHYVYTFSGWAYHSIGCIIALKQVPSQENRPGTVTCSIAPTTTATVYCAVPGNEFTFAGQAAISPVTVTSTLSASALARTTGGVYVAEVIAFNPVLADFISACPNPNWSVVAVVLTQFDSTILVRDSGGVLATQVNASCVIPPQFQNEPPDPDTQYVCNVTAQHVS